MSSTSETGHAINIANFKLLIDECNAFGSTYNPSNARLKTDKMIIQWETANTAHQALTLAIQQAKIPINEREILFEPTSKLVTRTLNYFESTDASKEIKKDAKGLADKFRGFHIVVEKLPDGNPDPKHVSNSHMSFVQRADTFKQLIDLYSSDVNYAPNENDLKIDVLRTLYESMKTANDNIGTIIAPVNVSRITRDDALYTPTTGIVDTAMACKDYVVGLFGAEAPQTKLVRKIEFRRLAK